MNATRKKYNPKAFTLLELLIAMSMVVLILSSVYATYSAATKASANSGLRSDLQQQASLFLQIITKELRCTHQGTQKPKTKKQSAETTETRSESAGIKPQKKKKYPPIFQGYQSQTPVPFLSFVTTSANTTGSAPFDGLNRVDYIFDPQTGTISKSIQKHLDQTEDDIEIPDYTPILENIIAVLPEFFDGDDWTNDWDSKETETKLPAAVRITIESQAEGTDILTFTATARIDCVDIKTEKPAND
jgi:prepilin-type N-terminal cleavage/methylation domain-containing protein